MNIRRSLFYLSTLLPLYLLTACSTTSAIEDGEQLFTGLKPIRFTVDSLCEHAVKTQEEMEYVLASAPNGALFGSSYYRSPLNPKLWIWNAFSQKESPFAKWMTSTFATAPKLLSQVNPRLRASVAESQLKKYGYFNAHVDYDIEEEHNPKKAKIAYRVDMGHLWTLDSIAYAGFSGKTDSLLRAHQNETLLHPGDAFSVSTLDGERERLSTLFRNNGFYYYEAGNASYLADTINTPGRANLRLQLADSLNQNSLRQFYIGRVGVNLRQTIMQPLTDTLTLGLRQRNPKASGLKPQDSSLKRPRRVPGMISIRFNGSKPRLRPNVILRGVKLRPGQLYSADNEVQTMQNLQAMGLFSYTSLQFLPSENGDTLNLNLDCVFDKPYNFYVETNAKGKTTGRIGPELVIGLGKRNAFHGGETLDINFHGSYEWDTHSSSGQRTAIDTYEFGGDVSVELPRLWLPWQVRRRWPTPPTTLIKGSANIINRAGYFRMHTAGGELTYRFHLTPSRRHEFSPLIVEYQKLNSTTEKFDAIIQRNSFTLVSMRDQFIPKMRYTYTYTNAGSRRGPLLWETTFTEAGNLLSLGYVAAGKDWNQKGKQLFRNPYAQYIKLNTDITKTWLTGLHSSLVAHVAAGAIWYYGNAEGAPYSEQFWVGGANSIRAFSVRSIGPGRYKPTERELSYLLQVGDIKFQANLEYRFLLAGSLHGAAFLDAGNVWSLHGQDFMQGADTFKPKEFLNDLALGTGIGLRYDLDYFVVRVDWGIGLHLPYDTGRSGYYNPRNFGSSQSIHLAIGYPF